MILTEANVLHYLLEKRFADLDSVVSGAFTAAPLTHKNRNFRVVCGSREYLVKQVKNWSAESQAHLGREAAFYWHAKTDPRWAPVAALIPQSYAWDPANSILILEFLPDHTDLHDMPDRFAPELARLAGSAMGYCHRSMASKEFASLFPGEAPSILSLHEVKEDEVTAPSPGRLELIRVVKKYREFGPALERLREEWHEETLVHGDWKIENCLISPDRRRVRIVDWELAGFGDPCWDVGTALQSYWNFWVCWPSNYSIEEIQPALGAFLDAYAESRGCEANELALQAIRFAGARMLQTAFEVLEKKDSMTAEAVRLAQASLNILTRPEWAQEHLLGMRSTCLTS